VTLQVVTQEGGWTGFRKVDGDGTVGNTAELINILDTVDVPIVVMQRELLIAGFNEAAGVLLDLSASDVGRTLGDIAPLAFSPRIEEQCPR
jgi:hypothetical protein